jgi:purine-nucleoside/S-methyl-5'-thioadenosine phosphorylase / adenosine deaminase
MNIGRIVVPPGVPDGFALFYTTRDFPGFLGDDVARELTGFIEERFGIAASLTTCNQVHGATVLRGERTSRPLDPCDALYSTDKNTALGIKVADCLPVTMIDPVHSVIANIHSGWRGAAQAITAKTLDTIIKETTFDPATAKAWLGPSIRVCCFEVGEEVAEQFDARYVDRSHAKPHVDLPAFNTAVLRDRGFADDAIIDTELCTRCEGSIFHSYRRDRKGGGRNLALVAQ